MPSAPPTELTQRSDARRLPPASDTSSPQVVLNTEARAGAWRLIETFSVDGLPFEVDLSWAAGAGNGARALITVPHSTRICVFARSLVFKAVSLGAGENRVGVTVADGFSPTRNTFEHRGEVLGAALGEVPLDPDLPGDLDLDVDADPKPAVELPRPPFAQRLRIQLSRPARLAGSVVELRGPSGRLLGAVPLEVVATFGLTLGGASRILLRPDGPTAFTATYTLSL